MKETKKKEKKEKKIFALNQVTDSWVECQLLLCIWVTTTPPFSALLPLPFQTMASKSIVKCWIQRLLPACDGDLGHTKRQLEWLKEKVTLDLSGDSSKSIYSLSKQEQDQLDVYITQRTKEHKPLQYILGQFFFFSVLSQT